MWRHALFLTVVVALALALSIVLIPRGPELALMHFKARSYRQALAGFEQAFLGRDAGPTLVVPLSTLYLREGEIDAAVQAIDKILSERPDDLEALDLALDVYRNTMHEARYLRALEQRVARAPAATLVRRLAALHALNGNAEGEQDALAELVGLGMATPRERIRLARSYAASGDDAAALEVVGTWALEATAALGRADIDFIIALQARQSMVAEAGILVSRWLDGKPVADRFLQVLQLDRRHPALGMADIVAEALTRHPGASELVWAAFVVSAVEGRPDVLVRYGQSLDTHQGLRALRRGGLALPPLTPAQSHLLDRTIDESAGIDTMALGVLIRAGHTDLIGRIAARRGDEPVPGEPWLRAAWWMLRGESAKAASAYDRIAPSAGAGSPLERAHLELALGYRERLRTTLERHDDWADWELPGVAWLYYDAGLAASGFEQLEQRLRADPTLLGELALLAAGAGQTVVARDALRRHLATKGHLAGALGFELAVFALEQGDTAMLEQLSVAALSMSDPTLDATQNAWRLLSAGRTEAALTVAAASFTDGERERDLFKRSLLRLHAALGAAASTDRTLSVAWQYLIAAMFEARDVEQAALSELRALAFDLIAVGAEEQAYAVVERLLADDPDGWYDAYRALAVALGREDDFLVHVIERLAVLPEDDPRVEPLVYDLNRLGGRDYALPYFEAVIARQASSAERRQSAFYAWRENMLTGSRREEAVTRIVAWLQRFGAEDPLADVLLYELGELGGAAAALPFLEHAALNTAAPSAERLAAFYTFASAAGASGQETRVAALAARALRSVDPRSALAEAYAGYLVEANGATARDGLERLAERDPLHWAETYLGWLDVQGESDAALAFVRRQSGRGDSEPALARVFAERLLVAGDKAAAITIYRRLAAGEPPDGRHMRMLLWWWGPRPGRDAVDWLAEQAASSSGRVRVAWAEILAALGDGEAAGRLLRPLVFRESPDVLAVERYVQMLEDAHDKAAAAAVLDHLVQRLETFSTPMRTWVAQSASDLERPSIAERAWRAVLVAAPDHPLALKRLGLAAFDEGRRGDAERYLERLLAQLDDDLEVHFFYAELLTERGFDNRAALHYQRVLELTDGARDRRFRPRVIRAQALHRLGFATAALEAFEALLAERPGEGHLRADYATMLLDDRRVDRARAVLAERSAKP